MKKRTERIRFEIAGHNLVERSELDRVVSQYEERVLELQQKQSTQEKGDIFEDFAK